MPNALNILWIQLKEIWRHFGASQRFSVVSGLVVTLALMAGLIVWSARPDFRLLYSGLSLKDASSMREKLDDEKVRTVVRDSGHALYVPAADVYRARLLLASQGFPKDTTVGFELFEQPKFGLTDFAQQVNYQRSLQGELERTISSMQGIDSARVLLVMPRDKLFASEREKQASASILLRTSGGVALLPAQVQSIVQLVGSSVPGLQPTAVTVSDQNGNLLSRRVDSSEDSLEQAGDQLVAQEKTEAMLSKKAQEMLDRAFGAGRSIVRVTVAIDLSKIDRRSESYDNENKVVRSETIESENTSAPGAAAGGAAGVVANIPVGSPASGTVDQNLSKSKKENIRTEYAIPSDVEHVIQRGARIQRLSISVCVARGQNPRTPEELKQIEQMVRHAVGFVENEIRKDSIEVTEMEFMPSDPVPVSKTSWWNVWPDGLSTLGRGVLGAIVLFIVYRMSRRIMSNMLVRREEAGVPIQSLIGDDAGGGVEGRRTMFHAGVGAPVDSHLEEITRIAEQNPKSIAAWISNVTGTGS